MTMNTFFQQISPPGMFTRPHKRRLIISNRKELGKFSKLGVTFLLIIALSWISSFSVFWKISSSITQISTTTSAGGGQLLLKQRIDNQQHRRRNKLDRVLGIREIIQMNRDCPSNRKLRVNASEPFDSFVHNVFVTSNNSVHEPYQRPIEEIADTFQRLVETNQFITNGFWAEFGVFLGSTLKYASDRLISNTTTRKDSILLKKEQHFRGVMVGFDSFEGLPISWRKGFPKGDFGGRGKQDLYKIVRSNLPDEVELYKGWFQDTIGLFKDKYPRMPAAVIHHDADLFLSTSITLQLLADRIVPGTHMIFDEIFGYPGYENHEILALYLWMVDHDAELCVMGHKSLINETDYRLKKEQDPSEQSVWFQVLSVNK
jgi:hypothetical protein